MRGQLERPKGWGARGTRSAQAMWSQVGEARPEGSRDRSGGEAWGEGSGRGSLFLVPSPVCPDEAFCGVIYPGLASLTPFQFLKGVLSFCHLGIPVLSPVRRPSTDFW